MTDNRTSIPQLSADDEKLLQHLFLQMVEELGDARTRNLIFKNIKDYHEAVAYLNDSSLVTSWYGAGHHSIERIGQFFHDFQQEYLSILGGHSEKAITRLLSVDYPFLTANELAFAASFLQTERRYPVLFIASRYLQRSANKRAQIFAKANGILGCHLRFDDIGDEYAITRERVRQLSLMSVTEADDAGQTWNRDRWQALSFIHQPVLTESIVHWTELQQKEQLGHLDFYAVLAMIRQIAPFTTVSLRSDGRRANSRFSSLVPWQKPDVLFAYDNRYRIFSFENALAVVGHQVSLQRIAETRLSLSQLVAQHFNRHPSDEDQAAVIGILRVVLPLFPNVETADDDIIFRANRTNYIEDIYQILQRHGEAMTIDAIYDEFRQMHPDDHHTDSSFIRSYMLRNDKFEAVGSKSTYQLREWNRFAGSLSDLAVLLLTDSDEPLPAQDLCRMMFERRPNTTLKSCNSSIYIATADHRLLFYIDVEAAPNDETPERLNDETAERPNDEAPERPNDQVSRYHVGLFDRSYPSRFWPAPVSIEGIIRAMRRFLEEYARWPFSSGKTPIEAALYHVLRKFKQQRRVSPQDIQRYQQAMADINPDDFPSIDRELQFHHHCQEFLDFCYTHHHLPTTGKLLLWYRTQCAQQNQLTGYRKNRFLRLQADIEASRKEWELPFAPVSFDYHSAKQLSLDFED